MQKVLIIRFSSLGDIVLTSPIIRCVKNQVHCKIHFLTKVQYSQILDSNPHIDRLIILKDNINETIKDLKSENYSHVIDLHNNLRSFRIKIHLRGVVLNYKKQKFKRFLLLYFGLNSLKEHVVDRYFNCVKKLNVKNDNNGLDYFLNKKTFVNIQKHDPFLVWCIGASFEQKTLSVSQIVNVCNNLSARVLLIGGHQELSKGDLIVKNSTNTNIDNFCGRLSIDESAYLIKHSSLVLTNDTGFMHIAAAFKKNIISFWGCTKPSLGFYPYMTKNKCLHIVFNEFAKPCSKHGNFCRIRKDGCIKNLKSEKINDSILEVMGD